MVRHGNVSASGTPEAPPSESKDGVSVPRQPTPPSNDYIGAWAPKPPSGDAWTARPWVHPSARLRNRTAHTQACAARHPRRLRAACRPRPHGHPRPAGGRPASRPGPAATRANGGVAVRLLPRHARGLSQRAPAGAAVSAEDHCVGNNAGARSPSCWKHLFAPSRSGTLSGREALAMRWARLRSTGSVLEDRCAGSGHGFESDAGDGQARGGDAVRG